MGHPPSLPRRILLHQSPDHHPEAKAQEKGHHELAGVGNLPASDSRHNAGMSAHLAPVPTSDLYVWRSGVESLSPGKSPCPGLYGEQWQKAHAAMLDFLERFGAQAVELGWSDLDLFGIHAVIGTTRADHCGALVLTGRQVEAIDAKTIRYGNLTYYRDVPGKPRGIPIWAFKG